MVQIIQIETSAGTVSFLFKKDSYCDFLTNEDETVLKTLYDFYDIEEKDGFVFVILQDGYYGLPEYKYKVLREATQEEIDTRDLRLQEEFKREAKYKTQKENDIPQSIYPEDAWWKHGAYHKPN